LCAWAPADILSIAKERKNKLKSGGMMRKILAFLFCVTLTAGLTACTVKSTGVSGDGGQPRIVTTSAALCEVLAQLDLDLVGVPNTSFTLPERYRDVTRVGLPMSPDLEILKSLKPTDVISPNSLQYDLKPKYESINVPSTFVNLMSVEGMFKSIEDLGKKYQKTEQADALIADYQAFMNTYNAKIEGKEKPRVLVLMGIPGAYMVATEKSYVGNLVKLGGGINVFDDEGGALLNVNTEAISQTDPDVILRAAHGLPDEVQKMFAKEFKENDIWKHFRAVKNGRVYDLDYSIFNMSASLGYKEGLNSLYEMLFVQE
jgi:iron complex transport system substrate-binding protein